MLDKRVLMVERLHQSGIAYLRENVREFVYEPGKAVEEVVAPGDEVNGFIVRLATARRDFLERTAGLEVVENMGSGWITSTSMRRPSWGSRWSMLHWPT